MSNDPQHQPYILKTSFVIFTLLLASQNPSAAASSSVSSSAQTHIKDVLPGHPDTRDPHQQQPLETSSGVNDVASNSLQKQINQPKRQRRLPWFASGALLHRREPSSPTSENRQKRQDDEELTTTQSQGNEQQDSAINLDESQLVSLFGPTHAF